jgi:hypothetical protein
LRLAYNILQAAGCRSFKTDYAICPSCGRTLFNLQTVTGSIKACTEHLKEEKIAIMGYIVNGLGEMADADFGYVGGAPGKINLYVGKTAAESKSIVELQIKFLGGQFHAAVKIFKELFCGFMQALGEIPGRKTKGLHLVNGEPVSFDTITDADRFVSFNLGISWRLDHYFPNNRIAVGNQFVSRL